MARKNYTAREKEELKIIVEKYKDIIENKNTNALVIAKKVEAWDAVALEFNLSAEYPRTAKQLLSLYHNLKRSTRQDLANDNIERYIQRKAENEIMKKIKKDEANDKKEIRSTGEIGVVKVEIEELDVLKVEVEELDVLSVEHQDLSEDLHEEALVSKEPSKLTQNATKKNQRKLISLIGKNENLKKNIYLRKLETAAIEKKEALIKLTIAQKQATLIDIEIKIKEQQLKNLQNQAV